MGLLHKLDPAELDQSLLLTAANLIHVVKFVRPCNSCYGLYDISTNGQPPFFLAFSLGNTFGFLFMSFFDYRSFLFAAFLPTFLVEGSDLLPLLLFSSLSLQRASSPLMRCYFPSAFCRLSPQTVSRRASLFAFSLLQAFLSFWHIYVLSSLLELSLPRFAFHFLLRLSCRPLFYLASFVSFLFLFICSCLKAI